MPRDYFGSLVLTEKPCSLSRSLVLTQRLCRPLRGPCFHLMARALCKLAVPQCPTDTTGVTGGTGTGIREVSCQAMCLELLGVGGVQTSGTGHCTPSRIVILVCSPSLYFINCWYV